MERQRDLISIIVPVYNIKEYLKRCVDSILVQTWENLEVLLVDDGSMDGTEKLVDELQKRDNRIRVFHKENGGSSSARNVGIREAKGRYLGFVDSDDYIEPFMYERLYRAIQETGMPIAQGGRWEMDEQGNGLPDICVPPGEETIYDGETFMRELLLHKGDCSFCTKLVDASLFEKWKFPEGKLNEDFHVLVQMLPEIAGIVSVPERVYTVFYKSGSNTRGDSGEKSSGEKFSGETSPQKGSRGNVSLENFSPVYGDNVDNADMVTQIVREHYPELEKTALRFGLYQRLDYLLHIPIRQMKKTNEQYSRITGYLKENRKEIRKNEELTKKQKLYLMLFSFMPVLLRKGHRWLKEGFSLLWMVIPLLVIFFSYFFLLGKYSVFEIHDQLDETLFTYVLNGKYLLSGVKSYPEMLCGVPRGGMSVSACIFVPLYKFLPAFQAFMIQFIVVAATAYVGMYLCVKKLTGSSFIGFLCGGMFMFLPYQPVYGLSLVGLPLVFYAFLRLYNQDKIRQETGVRDIIVPLLLILYFALGANLVLSGYVVLGFVFLADILIVVRWLRKDRHLPESVEKRAVVRRNKSFLFGSMELLAAYIVVNFPLFSELLLGNGGYVSHREEMVVSGNNDFWGCVKDVFLNSGQHAPSFHEKLIWPVMIMLVFYGFRLGGWRRIVSLQRNRRKPAEKESGSEKVSPENSPKSTVSMPDRKKVYTETVSMEVTAETVKKAKLCRNMYRWLVAIIVVNVLVALFYAFCQSQVVVDFRNSVNGFFHYFSPQRVYWIYPTTWYVAAGLAAGLIWQDHDFIIKKRLPGYLLAGIVVCVILTPTAWHIRQNSIWLLNKSQYKNNRSVGLMSWADYFAEDLMREIDTAIYEKTGLTKEQYRIASLGMCPAPALEAGFYCIDGYSNNYSLEYKHEFREIIEEELEKCPGMQVYFDTWGSRCYLFTSESQNYYYRSKYDSFRYEDLELNTEKMREMGCRYLFSAAEIEEENAERMGMELFGAFETEESYYRIWVYEMTGAY